jgi:type VI secretion system protein ImpB
LAKSLQQKLTRVRPPRVHITTDVETGDAIEMKELPFVVGVLGDFSGQPAEPLPLLRDRKFVEINPDNFDAVLEKMKPRLALTVENKLQPDKPDAGKLKLDLTFNSLEDFEPQRVAERIPALKELLDLRTKLGDLKGSFQGNPNFEEQLDEIVKNTEKRSQLAGEIEKSRADGAGGEKK